MEQRAVSEALYLVGAKPDACEAIDPGCLKPRHLPQCPAKPGDTQMCRLAWRGGSGQAWAAIESSNLQRWLRPCLGGKPALHRSHFLRCCWLVCARRHKVRSVQGAMLVVPMPSADIHWFGRSHTFHYTE